MRHRSWLIVYRQGIWAGRVLAVRWRDGSPRDTDCKSASCRNRRRRPPSSSSGTCTPSSRLRVAGTFERGLRHCILRRPVRPDWNLRWNHPQLGLHRQLPIPVRPRSELLLRSKPELRSKIINRLFISRVKIRSSFTTRSNWF